MCQRRLSGLDFGARQHDRGESVGSECGVTKGNAIAGRERGIKSTTTNTL